MQDDATASNAGRAYVFDLLGAESGVPLLVLENPDPGTSDFFGNSVALSGGLAVVGGYLDDLGASDAGSVYVFDLFSATPSLPLQQLGKLSPGVADNFGHAVAVDGNRIVSGIPRDDTFGTDQGAVQIHGLGGLRPEIVVEDGSGVDLSSGSGALDFGALAPGGTSELSITVRNSGDAPLTGLVTQITGLNSTDFIVVTPPSMPVAPAGMTSLTLRFTAPITAVQRDANARLRLFTNDGDESVFLVDLVGTILGPGIEVELAGAALESGVATVDFGSGLVGAASDEKVFTVRNALIVDLTEVIVDLTGVSVTVTGDASGDYTIDDGSLGSLIAPGASSTFNVMFTPSAEGSRNAMIEITSNDGDENPFLINLTGRGIAPLIAAQEASPEGFQCWS